LSIFYGSDSAANVAKPDTKFGNAKKKIMIERLIPNTRLDNPDILANQKLFLLDEVKKKILISLI